MVFPSSLQRWITSKVDLIWADMAPIKMKSAQTMSFVFSFSTFRSMSFFSQLPGSKGAMVSKPNGGLDAFFDTNLSACLKLQKVSGYSGYTSRIFMLIFFVFP